MRLQSDPTIVYGLVGGKGTLGRGIQRAEIDQPTPYNTYVIEGLPPGPIANPGRAALEAVANPSRTKDLYFVADGSGGHVFAETLDQHQRNVARWRQIEKRPRRTPDPQNGRRSDQADSRRVGAEPAAGQPPPDRRPCPGRSSRHPSRRGRPCGFDASEGTAKDPLLNKTFDLNARKRSRREAALTAPRSPRLWATEILAHRGSRVSGELRERFPPLPARRVRVSAIGRNRAKRSEAGVEGATQKRARRPKRRAPDPASPPHPRLLRRLAAFGGPLPASGERRSAPFVSACEPLPSKNSMVPPSRGGALPACRSRA